MEKTRLSLFFHEEYITITFWVVTSILLVFLRTYSYILFHITAELFSIIISIGIFMICWQTRRLNPDSFYLFLAIAFFFISIIDVIHTFAYKGMNIFVGFDTNLPTQLWILGRYMQSISLILASIWIYRKFSFFWTFLIYLLITTFIVWLIFRGIFPNCYIEGIGLTPFKIISEYIIIGF